MRIDHRSLLPGIVLLLASAQSPAASGDPKPEIHGSPPPRIEQYLPFPAQWNATITIHGSHLLVSSGSPSQPSAQGLAPERPGFAKVTGFGRRETLVEAADGTPDRSATIPEGPKPVLKWGVGNKAAGTIPSSDIELWTQDEIRIKQLPGVGKGAHWIAIYQNGERVSNRNKTLLFESGDPNALAQLAGWDDDEEQIQIQVAYPPVEEPTNPQALVLSYQPTIVGAGDDVTLHGYFPAKGNLRLMYGTGNVPLGQIPPGAIQGWNAATPQVTFTNEKLPTGVHWVGVFQGLTLVSNLELALQVTEDPTPAPPPGPPRIQTIRAIQGSGSSAPQAGELQTLPNRGVDRGRVDTFRSTAPGGARSAPTAIGTEKLQPKIPVRAKGAAPAPTSTKTRAPAVPAQSASPSVAPTTPDSTPRVTNPTVRQR